MREGMDADEFHIWLAEYQRAPWGPVREDLAAGMIVSTLINIHSEKGRGVSPGDVMPYLITRDAAPREGYASDDETVTFLQGFM